MCDKVVSTRNRLGLGQPLPLLLNPLLNPLALVVCQVPYILQVCQVPYILHFEPFLDALISRSDVISSFCFQVGDYIPPAPMFQDLKAARVDRDRKHRPPGLKMSDTFVMLFVQVPSRCIYFHHVLPLSRLVESLPSTTPPIILGVPPGAEDERHLRHALRPGAFIGISSFPIAVYSSHVLPSFHLSFLPRGGLLSDYSMI